MGNFGLTDAKMVQFVNRKSKACLISLLTGHIL